MKIIVHIDLNAFFAQVEMNRRPEAAGQPLAVGRLGGRGVIATANYKARKFGVYSGMPSGDAVRLCPGLVLVPGDFAEYSRQSHRFFSVVQTYFPIMEMASIDEAYCEGTQLLLNLTPERRHDVLFDIQMDLLRKTGLKCSIGMGSNRFLAKMASDYKKPLGITAIMGFKDCRRLLWPLPVGNMFGVGRKTAPRLEELGIQTIGDLAQSSDPAAIKLLGSYWQVLNAHANGYGSDELDLSPFNPKSCSSDTTLPMDSTDLDELEDALIKTATHVAKELAQYGKTSRTIAVKLRDDRFVTSTKRETFATYANAPEVVAHRALAVFNGFYRNQPIRLIGCAAEDCVDLKTAEETAKPEAPSQGLFGKE